MSLLKEHFMVSWTDANGVKQEISADSPEEVNNIANAVGASHIVTISIVTPIERRYPAREREVVIH